ncbi:MAG: hypothetical protein M5U29_04680 [Anaerolineae bacterium]|nr:hypothetical protein [Anaerolineae bacterium]
MVYNLIDWHFEYGAGVIAARPTLVNFVKRLGAALLIWFLLYLFYLGFELPSWASATTSSRVLLGIGGVVGAAALANPLSVLWQRLRIERDGCGDVVITSFFFRPRTIPNRTGERSEHAGGGHGRACEGQAFEENRGVALAGPARVCGRQRGVLARSEPLRNRPMTRRLGA